MGKIRELFITTEETKNNIEIKKLVSKYTSQKLFSRDVIILVNYNNLWEPYHIDYLTNIPAIIGLNPEE
jgi:hypothetical protein